ncbi:MAG: thioredoxin family protein [candidate division WS1 bacterium]|jgi:thiol-disulfide isomerase/thioredoxin|nr:thioredoxin family protein [candidate division WS1 bacterium]
MRSRLFLAVVIAVLTTLTAAAFAQEGVAAVDIANEGQAMAQAAEEGNAEQAVFHARRILGAAGADFATCSAEELYWIGSAHMYLMANAYDMALEAGLQGEMADTARKRSQNVLSPSEDLRVVSQGERVELTDYLVPGQTMIVDFYSEYCPPCVQIGPYIERLAEQRDDIILLKVDINRPDVQGIDWESPVARQYSLSGIPFFMVYGPDGELQAQGTQAREMIFGWLDEMEG